MSLQQIGNQAQYILPMALEEVPNSWGSAKAKKPVASQLQTVVVPSLSGTQVGGGVSVIQVPCGASAGLMSNVYLSFRVRFTTSANAGTVLFKGQTQTGASTINRLSYYVNGTQIGNISNADIVYDQLLAHSTSRDFIASDAKVLMLAGVATTAPNPAGQTPFVNVVLPLIGLFSSAQAIPAYLINGQISVQIDWNPHGRAAYSSDAAGLTAIEFSSVQLIYDKIQPDQSFLNDVRAQMASGQNYVVNYTDYQSTTQVSAAGTQTLNLGANLSSCRAVVASQILTAEIPSATARGLSANNGMSLFQVSFDGRIINSATLDSANSTAITFAEAQKCFSKLFDASITDLATSPADYRDNFFFVGVSGNRCSEGQAFAGSPVSVISVQTTTSAATFTLFYTLISDMSLLITPDGSAQLLR